MRTDITHTDITHYDVLEVDPSATGDEIKRAYRRLAKQLHPDRSPTSTHEAIAHLNLAYETLSDPLSRRSYDQHLRYQPTADLGNPQDRAKAAQQRHRRQRQTEPNTDLQLKIWLTKVYTPATRLISQIIRPLKSQIAHLSGDPFDDALMAAFQTYLETSRSSLSKAQTLFKATPNPPTLASAAAHLYYCLNQLEDALGELEYFTLNYDENSLHAGYEMFRIADQLKREAQSVVRGLPK
jgi:molecular chaperone DnaJ